MIEPSAPVFLVCKFGDHLLDLGDVQRSSAAFGFSRPVHSRLTHPALLCGGLAPLLALGRLARERLLKR
jgi:hypothetical protein